MSGLTSGVIVNNNYTEPDPPTGLIVYNSIAIPLDGDPDLILHYPLNGGILNYVGSNPTVGISDANFFNNANINLSYKYSIYDRPRYNQNTTIIENYCSSLYKSSNDYNAYLKIDNNNLFVANSGGYTFSCWVYITSTISAGMIWSICNDNTINQNYKYGIYFNSPNLQLYSINGSGTNVNTTFNTTTIYNQWYHIVWTLNTSSQSNVYLNSSQILFNNTTIPYFNTPMNSKYIFGDTSIASTVTGYMNDFRYYNRILSQSEVIELCNVYYFRSYFSNFTLNYDSSLILYYPFDINFNNYAFSGIEYLDISNNNMILKYNDFKVGNGSVQKTGTANMMINKIIPANTNGYSFSMWIKPLNTTQGTIFSFRDSANSSHNEINMYISANDVLFGVTTPTRNPPGIGNYLKSFYTYTFDPTFLNIWHHFVFTLNNFNTTKFYLDGTLRSELDISYINFDSSINIIFDTGTKSCNLDDFRYYNKILTFNELTELYNYRSTSRQTLDLNYDTSLCIYYTFDSPKSTLSNYAKNVYGVIDATYVNGASTSIFYIINNINIGSRSLKLISTSSQYVQLSTNNIVSDYNFISSNGMTFSFWFSSTSTINAKIFDFNNTYNSYSNNIYSIINNTSLSLFVYISSSQASGIAASGNYNNGNLYHFACTMTYASNKTSSWIIYINSVVKSSSTAMYYPKNITRTSSYLGKGNSSTDPYYNGYIDDFRVYQRVLTPTEISSLFKYKNTTLQLDTVNYSWTEPITSQTPLSYNYTNNFNNVTNNTSSTNALADHININNTNTYSVNTKYKNKQSTYVNVTKSFS